MRSIVTYAACKYAEVMPEVSRRRGAAAWKSCSQRGPGREAERSDERGWEGNDQRNARLGKLSMRALVKEDSGVVGVPVCVGR